jgi:hypothetical protein
MASVEKLGTHQKALNINLDPTTFGSFAEIGAGQEVVRWFLVVGGASGTVAKSISAYDKEVSDDLYGRGSRYVSRERLDAMLESELDLKDVTLVNREVVHFLGRCETDKITLKNCPAYIRDWIEGIRRRKPRRKK